MRPGRICILATLAAGCAASATPPAAPAGAPSATRVSQTASGEPVLAEASDAAAGDPPAQPGTIGAPPKDAERTPTGLTSVVLISGTGSKHPTGADRVRVRYEGWKESGEAIETLGAYGEIILPVETVIPGWSEALQLMVPGEKRRVWIPANLAYGDHPALEGAPAGNLVFDIELVEIVEPSKPPIDVATPPKTATRTKSGLAYVHLVHGTGNRHAQKTDRVLVHYSGWTTDGKLFDSSVSRGEPNSFGLDQVIKGWTEGVALMVEGDRVVFWIPAHLAYGDVSSRPGVPTGTLVFEVELLKIQGPAP